MARVNINILGISEIKWTRMGEFNSNDHCILYYWQQSLKKKWSSPLSQQKVQNAVLLAISKTKE